MPWLFGLPYLRRFDGYALPRLILLREPLPAVPDRDADDLLCHELCHVWQMQHHPLRLLVTVLTTRYELNPFEAEARWAVART